LIIAANIIVFVCMLLASGWKAWWQAPQDLLLAWGANIGAFTAYGEYWRLFTNIFVHNGLLHLGLNMYALWVLGPTVQNTFGQSRFIFIYLFSGLIGSVASIAWDPAQISAGASGSIVGMAGAMLAVLAKKSDQDRKQENLTHPLIFFAVICASLLYGFFTPGIDNSAHIGGLAGGFISGFLLNSIEQGNNKKESISIAVLVLMLALFAVWGTSSARMDRRSDIYRIASGAMKHLRAKEFQLAYDDYNQLLKSELKPTFFLGRAEALTGMKRAKEAVEDCDKAIALDPKNSGAYFDKALALHKLEDYKQAIEVLNKTIQANPLPAAQYNMRAWSELALGETKQALNDVNRCLAQNKESAEALDTRAVIYYCLKEYKHGLEDLDRALLLKPKEGACHYHRAMIYEQMGQNSKAAQEFDLARTLGYEPESWELALRPRNPKEPI
jgi:rhomboid protease GluP